MERGYVKLWRKTLDSGLLQHPTAWQVFGYLLMSATRSERKLMVAGQVFELSPGDYAGSVAGLCGALKLTARQVRTALAVLEKLEILTIKTTNKGSLFSIMNWHRYQVEGQTDDKQNANKRQAPDKPIEQERENINKSTSYSMPESPDSDGCPQQKVLAVYREELPSLTQPRTWRSNDATALRARWNEKKKEGKFSNPEEGLDYFRKFFRYVARSPFLMGKVANRDGRAFQADIRWLMKAANFDKVLEGKYHE
jgi:hypothetical protein